ncbi:hypothetical protein HMPREF9999_00179 [Alloprevotella sp. oral taxon 473 str. F0040]|nr:hypothetical protein HMPREF9999_00179 [Alloprevotella sp. oral taxon 473 str. F0040]
MLSVFCGCMNVICQINLFYLPQKYIFIIRLPRKMYRKIREFKLEKHFERSE